MAVFNHTMGLSFDESPWEDEQQTDGMLATNAISRLEAFKASGIGGAGGKPFFLAVGFHKPHLPHNVPKRYFDLYDVEKVSLAPNREVPQGFKEENWHANGSGEMASYNQCENSDCSGNDDAGPEGGSRRFVAEGFMGKVWTSPHGFRHPISANFSRQIRRGYFAATSFVDAQVGRVMAALDANGFKENTNVVLWSDHGWHLGDTNSWCKVRARIPCLGAGPHRVAPWCAGP